MQTTLPQNAVILSYHRSSSAEQRAAETHLGNIRALNEDAEQNQWPLHRFDSLVVYDGGKRTPAKQQSAETVFVDDSHTILLDLGVSAERYPLWERPAGRVLLETAKELRTAGKLPVLRSTFLDRLIRLKAGSAEKARQRGEFTAVLLELDALIYTINEGWLDPEKLETSIRLSIVEADSDTRHRRMIQGKLAAAEHGHWPGGCTPFGYRLELTGDSARGKQGSRSRLVVDDEKAKVVRSMFEMCLRGVATYRIALTLNAQGTLTNKGVPWRPQHVRGVLSSETYKGVFNYSKYAYEQDPMTGRKKQRLKPRSEWVSCSVPGIIDDATWQKAQPAAKDGKKSQGTRTDATEYLLGKLLRCGVCHEEDRGYRGGGRGMYGQRSNLIDGRLYCNARFDQFGKRCSAPSQKISDVNQRVSAQVHRMLMKPEKILAIWQEQFDSEGGEAMAQRLESLKKKRDGLAGHVERADFAYVSGTLTRSRYQKQVDRIEAEGVHLDQEIHQITAKLDAREGADALKDSLAHALTFAGDGILSLVDVDDTVPSFLVKNRSYSEDQLKQFRMRKAIIHACVERIHLHPGGEMVLDYRVNPRKLSAAFLSVDGFEHPTGTKTPRHQERRLEGATRSIYEKFPGVGTVREPSPQSMTGSQNGRQPSTSAEGYGGQGMHARATMPSPHEVL